MAPVVLAPAALLAIDIAETVLIQLVGQLVSSVVGAALAPELLELQQLSFKLTNTKALDPGLSIEAFIRGHRSEADSKDDLGAAGYAGDLWQAMADSAGEPLPLDLAAEAWRRGIIPKSSPDPTVPSLEKAIRDSRIKNAWTPTVEALQFQLPPMGTIIEGWLRAQITPAEALKFAYQSGVDEPTATLMYKSAGRPPGPQELATMWHRGIIPEGPAGGDNLTLAQGYKETDLKDKWYEKWRDALEYRPPPRTIVALLRAGAITDAQATTLLEQEGLSAANVAIYIKSAHHERSATTKELTKAEWVQMYVDQAITAEELKTRLTALGFGGESADLEIQLADLRVTHALEQRAVNRIGSTYVSRKIDKGAAFTALDSLKIPAPQRDRLLAIWTQERASTVHHLSPVEIAYMVKSGTWDVPAALAELGVLGYGARDAWVVLAYELKAGPGVPMPTDNLPPA